MARSPRSFNASTAVSTPTPKQPLPATRSSRGRSALASASTPTPTSAPPPPSTPLSATPDASGSTSKSAKAAPVEAKAHGLRSVHGERERVACPFPEQYGGNDKCGVSAEDLADEVLMAVCAACASLVGLLFIQFVRRACILMFRTTVRSLPMKWRRLLSTKVGYDHPRPLSLLRLSSTTLSGVIRNA